MARCGCGGGGSGGTGECGCVLSPGGNVEITGAGSAESPWVVTAVTNCDQVRACLGGGAGITFNNGTGVISARVSTDPDNALSINGTGLFVPKQNAPCRLVAAFDAPQWVKDQANFVCDGVADQVTIQTAVDAAFAEGGGCVQLSQGTFLTSGPVTLHPVVRLIGSHGDQIFNPGQITVSSYIRPVPGFAGGAVIVMLDNVNGGYPLLSAEQQIESLTIDGTGVGGTVHGIQAGGYIHGVLLRDVAVKNVSGKGIYTFTENGGQPFSWTFEHVIVDNPEGVGIHLINHSDCTMVDVVSIGAGADAFTLSNMPNSRFEACRAEWSEGNGYTVEGNFGTGAGSGGMSFTGCSSDRNRFDGMHVTATGNAPLLVTGCTFRRDGRNGNAGGGDYSGFRAVGSTMPIMVDNVSVYPGVDDGGAGVNSPVNAFKVSGSTFVALNSGFLHGATNGFVDGGGNGDLWRGPNIGVRTGTTAAPVDDFNNAWSASGYAVLDSGQSNGQWSTYNNSPTAFNIGSAGGGLSIKEGANARMGPVTLAGGTAVVPNTSITANTRVDVFRQEAGGTLGHLSIVKNPGVGFTVNSSSATETSNVAFVLFEPSP